MKTEQAFLGHSDLETTKSSVAASCASETVFTTRAGADAKARKHTVLVCTPCLLALPIQH